MAALTNPRFASNPTLASVAAGQATLRTGGRGDGVLRLQEALRDLGFNTKAYTQGGVTRGAPDGVFGPQTDAAVRNFQRHAARTRPEVGAADGVVGARTLAALDALAPAPGKVAWDPDQPCLIPEPAWGGRALRAVVVISEHRTFLFDEAGRLEHIYPNATGQGANHTDPGLKKVAGVLGEADARATGSRLWGNPDVFGPRIINLSWADGRSSGEELHGTSRPDQIGLDVSHGCVRHLNEDILVIAARLKAGDLVAVVSRYDDPSLSSGAIS